MTTNISEFYNFLDGMVAQFIGLPQAQTTLVNFLFT